MGVLFIHLFKLIEIFGRKRQKGKEENVHIDALALEILQGEARCRKIALGGKMFDDFFEDLNEFFHVAFKFAVFVGAHRNAF